MQQTLGQYLAELEKDLTDAYGEMPTTEGAETLAAKMLVARVRIGSELRKTALDSRMKKAGLKAIKAAVFLEAARKDEKKPSDSILTAIVDSSKLVERGQQDFDAAEVSEAELENWLEVTKEAHIFFRGLAKGRFD